MGPALHDAPSYWLLGWLESNRVKTIDEVAALLAKPSKVREMQKVAEQWRESTGPHAPPGLNLVAGTGLRLDDDLTCPSPSCRRRQVDVLFRHAWHYFDRVLLPDGVGDLLLHPPHVWDKEYVLQMLLDRIDVVLHIEQLGAIDLVYYYPKTWQNIEFLDPKQEAAWGGAWGDVEATLVSEGHYHVERLGARRFRVQFADPLLGVGADLQIKLNKGESDAEESLRAKAAHEIMHTHISNFEEDLQARRVLGGSLGAAVWSHERVLSWISGAPGTSEIFLRLELPGLAHISIRDLVAVRAAEGASFTLFRNALTRAAREMVSIRGVNNPRDAAAQIIGEIIEPELARLRQRLRAAQRALARKTAVSVVLAGLPITCGLLLGAPFVGAAATLASGYGVGKAASEYLAERQSMELTDMYFLWKALGHAD